MPNILVLGVCVVSYNNYQIEGIYQYNHSSRSRIIIVEYISENR